MKRDSSSRADNKENLRRQPQHKPQTSASRADKKQGIRAPLCTARSNCSAHSSNPFLGVDCIRDCHEDCALTMDDLPSSDRYWPRDSEPNTARILEERPLLHPRDYNRLYEDSLSKEQLSDRCRAMHRNTSRQSEKSLEEISVFSQLKCKSHTRTASAFDPRELEDEVCELVDWQAEERERQPLRKTPQSYERVEEPAAADQISFRGLPHRLATFAQAWDAQASQRHASSGIKTDTAESCASARFLAMDSHASQKHGSPARSLASADASLVRTYALPSRALFSKSSRLGPPAPRDERDFPSVREPTLSLKPDHKKPAPAREKSAIKGALGGSKAESRGEQPQYQMTDLEQTDKSRRARKERDLLEIFKLKQKKFR